MTKNDCTFFLVHAKCTPMYCTCISDVPRYCSHKISTVGLDAILNEEDKKEKEI